MLADSAEREALERDGWVVTARSWAAQLEAERCDRAALRDLVSRADATGAVRALTDADTALILRLDAATLDDYPGAEATAHEPLTPATATVGPSRRAYGVADAGGELVAMTFVGVEAHVAEVDFTVVSPHHRGLGLATAVKAASVLDLIDSGVTVFRTGGSADNAAILAANHALGFVVDEHWVTLMPPCDPR